jgi:hypothetical protein
VAYTATTALPYPHLKRATAGLRAELRHQLLAAGVVATPDWTTLAVAGPEQFTDERGRIWFGYQAMLDGAGNAAEDAEDED